MNEKVILTQESPSSIRIASYNIRKCVGLDWKRNPQRVLQVLQELDADIVLLQEADKRLQPRQGTLPVQQLYHELGYQFADLSMNAISHGWHGNTILYRLPLTVSQEKCLTIPTLEPRGAVSVIVSIGEQDIHLIGTHLSLLKHVRIKQIRFLVNYAQQYPYPSIIAGDLNEKKAEQWLDDGALSTFHLITPGASFHSGRPLLNLDRFLVQNGLTVSTAKVHHSALAAKASDHLPVVIDVCWGKTCS